MTGEEFCRQPHSIDRLRDSFHFSPPTGVRDSFSPEDLLIRSLLAVPPGAVFSVQSLPPNCFYHVPEADLSAAGLTLPRAICLFFNSLRGPFFYDRPLFATLPDQKKDLLFLLDSSFPTRAQIFSRGTDVFS